jgi:RHS repeat-associated protein
VDTLYDAVGRVSFKSYPYQGPGSPPSHACSSSMPGDTFAYDPLNRITQVTHSDNSTVLTSYIGRATSVQDEGNGAQRVQRISQVDGLGRLASLCEVTSTTLTVGISGSTTPSVCGQDISGTGFLTTYAYDTLGNLTSVAQCPLNPRTFTYDSLSRLLCADNPEVQNAACPTPDTGSYTPGTIRYGYDANSNLTSKIAPMPNQTVVSAAKTVTTTMAYDPLNRLLTKTYVNNDNTTNTTPSVTFNYDQTSALGVSGLLNTDGRASSSVVAGSQAGEVFSYDKLGRPNINSQCTPQNCGVPSVFPINYTYDLLGDVLTATNGTGVTLTFAAYNRALRMTGLTSSLSDSNHPTLYSSPHYNAAGSVTSAYIGNPGSGVSETRGYDGRLRVNSITDGSLYAATIPTSGGYAPDSDILLANDSVNGNWTYGYDAFNRLTSASATGQAYTYAYDRFGNRWQQNGPHSSQPGFDANNHMISGLGVTYDAAGNETSDGTTAYTYDSEDRIITATNSGSGTSNYSYDADGRRIRKTTTAGGTVDFLYDLGGHEITQVTSAGAWTRGEIYAGARHLGTYTGGTGGNTYFTFADWLGTERVRSTSTGAPYETCTSLPFGDWLTCTGGDPSPMHFTGKERDSESNLDNFGARYDSSQYGRFMTPDWSGKPQGVPYAQFGDPQSLNLYTYVRNNPITLVDADGHCWNWAKSICNYWNYGVWGSDQKVQAAEKTARAALTSNQQARAARGQSPIIYNSGNKDASGKPVYTTNVNSMTQAAVLDPIGIDSASPFAHFALAGGVLTGIVLYRSGGLVPGPGDIRTDSNGFVKQSQGVSLHTDPDVLRGRFPGAPVSEVGTIPEDLDVRQQGNDPGHYIIIPRQAGTLTPEQYRQAVGQIETRAMEEGDE